jgi:hypothetical protein
MIQNSLKICNTFKIYIYIYIKRAYDILFFYKYMHNNSFNLISQKIVITIIYMNNKELVWKKQASFQEG